MPVGDDSALAVSWLYVWVGGGRGGGRRLGLVLCVVCWHPGELSRCMFKELRVTQRAAGHVALLASVFRQGGWGGGSIRMNSTKA